MSKLLNSGAVPCISSKLALTTLSSCIKHLFFQSQCTFFTSWNISEYLLSDFQTFSLLWLKHFTMSLTLANSYVYLRYQLIHHFPSYFPWLPLPSPLNSIHYYNCLFPPMEKLCILFTMISLTLSIVPEI